MTPEIGAAVERAPSWRSGRLPHRDGLRIGRRRHQCVGGPTGVPGERTAGEPSADRASRRGGRAERLGPSRSRAGPAARRRLLARPDDTAARAGRRACCREITGGRATVGIRVPAHPMAQELLRAFGNGIAAPSANRFGHVSPTTAEHVRADLGDDVDVILDGGPSRCRHRVDDRRLHDRSAPGVTTGGHHRG